MHRQVHRYGTHMQIDMWPVGDRSLLTGWYQAPMSIKELVPRYRFTDDHARAPFIETTFLLFKAWRAPVCLLAGELFGAQEPRVSATEKLQT